MASWLLHIWCQTWDDDEITGMLGVKSVKMLTVMSSESITVTLDITAEYQGFCAQFPYNVLQKWWHRGVAVGVKNEINRSWV